MEDIEEYKRQLDIVEQDNCRLLKDCFNLSERLKRTEESFNAERSRAISAETDNYRFKGALLHIRNNALRGNEFVSDVEGESFVDWCIKEINKAVEK